MTEASNVRLARIRKGLTLQGLSLLTDVELTKLSRAERGLAILNSSELDAVSKVLGISKRNARRSIRRAARLERARVEAVCST
jgi:transcriptional regulator with XRE-family HTH domain